MQHQDKAPTGAVQTVETRMEMLVPLFQERLAAGQKVRFSPMGISMLPMLREGRDSVVLAPAPERLKKYDLPLYRRDNGSYVLHRVVEVGQTYTCIGDNQFRLERGIRRDQIIAVVCAFTRNGRTYSTENPLYRMYCFGWHFARPVRHLWRRGIRWLKRHM